MRNMETFKSIADYEGLYEVSNYGNMQFSFVFILKND